MIPANNITYRLTGTNFGLLSSYEKTSYINGYFFNDLFNNSNIPYGDELNTDGLISTYSPSELSSISGLKLWLDASDLNTISTSSFAVTSIQDKSPFKRLFISGLNNTITPILTGTWPLYPLGKKNCLLINQEGYLFNNLFYFDVGKPVSVYFIWKDLTNEGTSIPISFKTGYNIASFDGETPVLTTVFLSEFLFKNSYTGVPEARWGTREPLNINFRINSLSGLFFKENILKLTYDSKDLIDGIFQLSSYFEDNTKLFSTNNFSYTAFDLQSNNVNLNIDGSFILSGTPFLSSTSVGYFSGDKTNNFLFGELMVFDKILTEEEDVRLLNTLYYKWNLPSLVRENVTFLNEITGGVLTNISYEDFSVLTSIVSLPIQSCVVNFTIDLNGFDETVSKISKIIYEYEGDIYETSVTLRQENGNIEVALQKYSEKFLLIPKDRQVTSYSIFLSVFRFDGTLNKFILSGNLVKCSLYDNFKNSALLETNITDDPKDLLLVTENKSNQIYYMNKFNVEIPFQSLTGGDVTRLINLEVEDPDENVISLADLLDAEFDEEEEQSVARVPGISPRPIGRINPIRPPRVN